MLFFHDYKIVVAAGPSAGIGKDALYPVLKSMDDPLKTKTITLSCGKLTTGVTVKTMDRYFYVKKSFKSRDIFSSSF